MGKGFGSGEGKGQGHGEGRGQGRGEDTAANIAAGSACAVCFTVCMCLIGLPAMIIGIILVALFDNGVLFDLGLAMLLLAVLFTVGGVVMIILICTGCCGKYNRPTHNIVIHPAPATSTAIIVNSTQNIAPGIYGPQPPGYNQTMQNGGYYSNWGSPGSGQPPMPQYGEPPPVYGDISPGYSSAGVGTDVGQQPSQGNHYGDYPPQYGAWHPEIATDPVQQRQ